MSIDQSTGLISGTPNVVGIFNFEAKLQDSNGVFVTRKYTLKINAVVPDPPIIISNVSDNDMITIIYTAPLFDGGSIITHYGAIIYHKSYNTINTLQIAATNPTTNIIISGLTIGETYIIKIYAINSVGNSIENSTQPITLLSNKGVICYSGESKVLVQEIETFKILELCVKNVVSDKHYVYSSTQQKFVPIKINCISGMTNKFILIKKDLFEKNKPSENLYITPSHPILCKNIEIKAKNIIGAEKVILNNQMVYTLVTENRDALLINNIDVICWKYDEFKKKYAKSKDAIWIENKDMDIIEK